MSVIEPRARLLAHQEGVQRSEFSLPQCQGCGQIHHPLDMRCEACGGSAFEMVNSTGRGQVYSYIAIRRPEMSAAPSAIAALVDLEEGVRVVTNLVGVEFGEVELNMAVELDFAQTPAGKRVPVFRPTPVS